MNHLAHLVLAGNDPELRVGGFLADFVRGQPGPDLPPRVATGIRLHRHIDAFTDAHPSIRTLLGRFSSPWRRWAPIALDIQFDHFLARDFPRLTGGDLDPFCSRAAKELEGHRDLFPARGRQFLDYLVHHGLLQAYRDPDTVAEALRRMSGRTARTGPLARMPEQLALHAEAAERAFEQLWPSLRARCAAWRAEHLPDS